MKPREYSIITLAICALLAACGGGSQPASAPNAANTATAATPAPSAAQSSAPSAAPAADSPTEVFKAQNEARKRKDAAAMKANLSRASLALIEGTARQDKLTVDEWLAADEEGIDQIDNFQMRNEKIEGDTATVEISAGEDEWALVPFVREDGRWKIAMDKYLESLEKEIEENSEDVNAPENSNSSQ